MFQSHFSKAVAVTAMVAALYVGHGLHVSNRGVGTTYAAEAPKAEDKTGLTWNSIGLSGDTVTTRRAKVKGGWLVYVHSKPHAGTGLTGLTFVPDSDHTWQP